MSEATQRMEIREVRIWKKETYESENPGRFVARVEYRSPKGNIEIPLDIEVAESMLAFLAPVIAKFSRKAVETIMSDIENQVLALQSPPIDTPAIADKQP